MRMLTKANGSGEIDVTLSSEIYVTLSSEIDVLMELLMISSSCCLVSRLSVTINVSPRR